MASETVATSTSLAIDDCVGLAEPAEILARLTPDDLHPARLAGPHAWHPWGLTAAPPTDRQLRLLLPVGTRPATAERLVGRLEGQLARMPWPPARPLDIRRHDSWLDCRDDDARRSLIEVIVAADDEDRGQAEFVTRDGWPILDELAALNDRIRCINVDEPSRPDLADLTSWVEHKMAERAGSHRLVAPLPQLLADQARNHPTAANRLRTIISQRGAAAGHLARVLDYLADQVGHQEARSHARRR